MKCPDEGKLLLYLENQLSHEEHQDTINHLTGCAACSARLAALREDYDFAARNLKGLWNDRKSAPVTGQREVWQKIQLHQQFDKREVRKMKIKKFAIAAALVLALGAVGSMPSVRTAAANLLQVFRVEQVDTLTMTPGDMQKIEQAIYNGKGSFDIEDFGSVESVGESGSYKIESKDLAGLGFTVKAPSLTDEAATGYSLQKTPAIEIRPKVDKVNGFLKT
ncbi:MAG: putative transrane transcriptional regulator (anti-sigma factor), partial [Firmicutes bacterium]|nr:putative transrane transcriptional regulator (anti-sigma factor) [Bacillota bacterium]